MRLIRPSLPPAVSSVPASKPPDMPAALPMPRVWPAFLCLFLFFCFRFLLSHNMGGGGWNEVDILPLARQYADPSWMPQDWYLNQPAGYRELFQALFGSLAVDWGFLATSIVGRVISYGLVALGLAQVATCLRLRLPALLLVVVLFLRQGVNQGMAAGEWLVGGLEAKAIAYGLVLLALRRLLTGQPVWMALFLGLATSFHILVGGWAFLAMAICMAWHPHTRPKLRHLGLMVLTYVAASAFAIQPFLHQLFASVPNHGLDPSFIYVFLRLPHHLNPLSWSIKSLLKPVAFLMLLGISVLVLRRQQRHNWAWVDINQPQETLARFAVLTMIPFGVGMAIAPFDPQGHWLQYYPFRLGDVMLPLCAFLLALCALQQSFDRRLKASFSLIVLTLFSLASTLYIPLFQIQLMHLSYFPGKEQSITAEQQDLYHWIRNNTARRDIFITSPVEMNEFSWMAERPTIVKFKMFPQTPAGITEWNHRMSTLCRTPLAPLFKDGQTPWWQAAMTNDVTEVAISKTCQLGYRSMSAADVTTLMTTYQASYFVTQRSHPLDLPVVYQSQHYVIYGNPWLNESAAPDNSIAKS